MTATIASTIRGPLPSSDAVYKNWYNAFLEAKQQHRFWCFWPVYMPKINPNDLRSGLSGHRYDTHTIAQQLKPAIKLRAQSAGLTTTERVNLAKTGNPNSPSQTSAIRSWAPQPQRITAQAQEKRVLRIVERRVSPHIVTSFTPPSFGATVTEQPMAGRKVNYVRPISATSKIQEATISFVSTLTDDLNFSMNLAFQVGNRGASSVATKLYPFWLWPLLANRVLSIVDLGARSDPGLLRTAGENVADPGDYPALPVGVHEFVDPLITNIQFSEYSYGGTELLQTTVSIKVTNPGKYRYAVLTSPMGGLDTRFPTDVDQGSSYMPDGNPNHSAHRILDSIVETYGNHPMIFAKETKPELASQTARETYRHIQNIAESKRNTYMAKVNEIMGDSDTAGIIDRKGKLLPLLKPWPGPDPDPMRVPSSAPQGALSPVVTEAAAATPEEIAQANAGAQAEIDSVMETGRSIRDPDDPATGGEAATIDAPNFFGDDPVDPPTDPLEGLENNAGAGPDELDNLYGGDSPPTDEQLYNEQSSDNDFAPLATGAGEAPPSGPGSGAGQPIDWDTPTGPGTSGPNHDLPEEDFPDQPDDVLPEDL